jgi:hypothetical protein
MNVDQPTSRRAEIEPCAGAIMKAGPMLKAGRANIARGMLRVTAACVTAMCAAALLLGAPAALAQDAPPAVKIKPAKSKAAAKAKEAGADVPGDEKTAAAPVKRDPAQAQRTLDSGIKLLQAGKAEPAIQAFSSIISGGHVPPQLMARALHQRGAAYGLSDADRADAAQQRTAAYREAGLPDQSDPSEAKGGAKRVAAALQAVDATSAPSQSVTTASLAPEPTRPAPEPSSPLGTLFGNLFGSGSSNASAPVAPQAETSAPPQQPATSGWSSNTATPAAAPKTARAAAVIAPPPATQAVTPAKAFTGTAHARIVARSEAEANTLAGRLKSEFGGQMSGRTPDVSQAQFGGMGSFFQVRVGPYRTAAEAQQFCDRIKASGADCVGVNQ